MKPLANDKLQNIYPNARCTKLSPTIEKKIKFFPSNCCHLFLKSMKSRTLHLALCPLTHLYSVQAKGRQGLQLTESTIVGGQWVRWHVLSECLCQQGPTNKVLTVKHHLYSSSPIMGSLWQFFRKREATFQNCDPTATCQRQTMKIINPKQAGL